MQKDGTEGYGIAGGEFIDCSSAQKQEKNGGTSSRLQEDSVDREAAGVISIVVSRGDACNQVPAVSELKGNVTKTSSSEKDVKADAVPLKKGCLSRSESDHEECRGAILWSYTVVAVLLSLWIERNRTFQNLAASHQEVSCRAQLMVVSLV